MRFLAVDLGDKRTGLAIADEDPQLVHPLVVLEIPLGPMLVDAIDKAINEHGADAIVLGLPLDMDGSIGPRAKLTQEFGEQIASQISIKIYYQDERLTSVAAEEHLSQSGKTHKQKKRVRDALAAAEILTDFLGTRNHE
ncbi:MAG TPA: Holliday junction resolvase RuvX [Phycisphaerales bacterium]|jgi:putative Holliday junction resolvase|nr:Holliday junction resolvase RuvX [Phycisphaerales bacterium]|tara:strand:- start:338 stop:754 length:417 start_codon:yes stop_codon:yes gene_type:complete